MNEDFLGVEEPFRHDEVYERKGSMDMDYLLVGVKDVLRRITKDCLKNKRFVVFRFVPKKIIT